MSSLHRDHANLLCIFKRLFNVAARGSGPTSNRLLWLANIDTALTVSGLANSDALCREAQDYFDTPIDAHRPPDISQD